LMLQYYTSKIGARYGIPWEGWMLSGSVTDNDMVVGMHNQD
jgi:hypothetical protein